MEYLIIIFFFQFPQRELVLTRELFHLKCLIGKFILKLTIGTIERFIILGLTVTS